ncbi:hypothetical protein ACNF5F_27300, partial [Escherichia coli]|uniref:hypothetical protein n=1 Tax=Escherichia coli TaxID=562 RepID=UPI003BA0BAA7
GGREIGGSGGDGRPVAGIGCGASDNAGPAMNGNADCHHHAAMHADQAPQAKAPAHDTHCQIKDCVRSCAQHPLLVVQALPF